MEYPDRQVDAGRRNESVAVIGSGIAGCLAAYELASQHYDVTILEERDEVLSGTSARAIQAHLGGLYSGNIETAQECLRSAIKLKKAMPFSLNERKAMFLVADKSEASFDEYIKFYAELAGFYDNLPFEDHVFGVPENFFRILQPREYDFAKNIEGGIATQEPGLDMEGTKKILLRMLGKLGVSLALKTEVIDAKKNDDVFTLTVCDNETTEEVCFDQVVNAGGYKARLLDHRLGDQTEYNLYLKTWNILRNHADREMLPPFYIVRGDFMHHSPIGNRGLVSLITATNEGSYLGRMTYTPENPELPTDWVSILKNGDVPCKHQRQQIILDYAGDNFLKDINFEPVDLVPGVAVSFSSSRQDRTKRGANVIIPGWQTIVPTKATNALELAREATANAINYSNQR